MKHIKLFENFIYKTLMNLYICDRGVNNDIWIKSTEIINNFNFPIWINPSFGHWKGYGMQIVLDANLKESIEISKNLINKLPITPLIVLYPINLNKSELPIGEYYDNQLIKPGRYFDKLIKENKKGIFIYEN